MERQYLLLIPFAFLGGYAGYRLKIPAGTVIGSLLAVAGAKLFLKMEESPLPDLLNFIPQALVGLILGAQFSRSVLIEIANIWEYMILSVVVLVLAGVAIAVLLMKLHVLDMETAYLGTSPGALAAMIFLAVDQHVNVPLVAVFHLFRVFFILLTGPFVLKAIAYLK